MTCYHLTPRAPRPETGNNVTSLTTGGQNWSGARDSDGTQYTVFTSDDQPRSGLVLAKRSEIEPNWLPFGLVGDFDAKLEKAVKLGGRVLAREGGSAIVIDPTGAETGVIGRQGETE